MEAGRSVRRLLWKARKRTEGMISHGKRDSEHSDSKSDINNSNNNDTGNSSYHTLSGFEMKI